MMGQFETFWDHFGLGLGQHQSDNRRQPQGGAGQRDHDMKGRAPDRQPVVAIRQAELAIDGLAAAKGVPEHARMGQKTRDHQRQHHHAHQAHDDQAERGGQVQIVVQVDQEFGKAVIDNQFVAFRIAEMQTEVEALRALLHSATEKYVAGEDVTTLASMAKYKMGRLAEWIPGECLRFWGGQGFMHENRISRTYRDMKVGAIGGGSNEIMLQIIAKRMKLSG